MGRLTLGLRRCEPGRVRPAAEWDFSWEVSAQWLGTLEDTHQEMLSHQDPWSLMADPCTLAEMP